MNVTQLPPLSQNEYDGVYVVGYLLSIMSGSCAWPCTSVASCSVRHMELCPCLYHLLQRCDVTAAHRFLLQTNPLPTCWIPMWLPRDVTFRVGTLCVSPLSSGCGGLGSVVLLLGLWWLWSYWNNISWKWSSLSVLGRILIVQKYHAWTEHGCNQYLFAGHNCQEADWGIPGQRCFSLFSAASHSSRQGSQRWHNHGW